MGMIIYNLIYRYNGHISKIPFIFKNRLMYFLAFYVSVIC